MAIYNVVTKPVSAADRCDMGWQEAYKL